jgi:hypothetical protein
MDCIALAIVAELEHFDFARGDGKGLTNLRRWLFRIYLASW